MGDSVFGQNRYSRIFVRQITSANTIQCKFCTEPAMWAISRIGTIVVIDLCEQCLAEMIAEANKAFYSKEEVLARAERYKVNNANEDTKTASPHW